MPRSNSPRPASPPSRLSRARPDSAKGRAALSQRQPVTQALDARLHQALGWTGPPHTVQCTAVLLRALRMTFAAQTRDWFPLVPLDIPGRGRDPARERGLDLADLRVLHRGLRIAWLAELVFGDQELAHLWLCQPKRRLQGRVPLLLAQFGQHAQAIEQWLVDIDEGNGP
ncbi:MbcA/ParS/Xre antitoxin family protein [Achromobacter sp.]|uniref:MbcA/ParS/Xre antitoxin family protein n=1 Tax=Achromobacter sp. TaxID=134375 RepID=UPI0028A6D02D|nr:MbcA/ParS/Xre antitoxin family protein [Achromobacter sp.]